VVETITDISVSPLPDYYSITIAFISHANYFGDWYYW